MRSTSCRAAKLRPASGVQAGGGVLDLVLPCGRGLGFLISRRVCSVCVGVWGAVSVGYLAAGSAGSKRVFVRLTGDALTPSGRANNVCLCCYASPVQCCFCFCFCWLTHDM